MLKKNVFWLLMLCTVVIGFAQQKITGNITDTSGAPIAGANVVEKGSANGTTTDFDGNYTITVANNAVLVISYVGFTTTEKNTTGKTTIDVQLAEGMQLDDVVLVGSRAVVRSNTTSSLPVDILSTKDLAATGQPTFDKALQYKIPSFNTVQTPVNDATSLLDPYEIRNMGPSRTLILINGKRKNLSALLYTQASPGRGETGSDISAIPTDAIKRVEVLRDGASAQYGSDAIAGVMNIILKDNNKDGSVNIRTGITAQGDGEMLGISLNNGSSFAEKGFINYTVDFSKVKLANRPGDVDAEGEYLDFVYTNPDSYKSYVTDNMLHGQDITGLSDTQIASIFEDYKTTASYTTARDAINTSNTDGKEQVNAFLKEHPDAKNINGVPQTTAAKFLINAGLPISNKSDLYFNAAYVYKKVNSFANYRTPYWRTEADYPYLKDFFADGKNGTYIGYAPTFNGDLNDYNATLGIKSKKNGWHTDASITLGANKQTYSVTNSHNGNEVLVDGTQKYRENSPIAFNPGGTKFSHIVGNLDLSKAITETFSIAFGTEFRTENFEVIEGDLASYQGGGADSFAGNSAENAGIWNRYNIGAYLDAALDITDNLLVNGTARLENYSDFGDAFVWKVSSRYKMLEDKLTFRGSISTGFRAPTLHQIYTQKAQYYFIPGQGIQVGGLVSNVSAQANLLDIPGLTPEKSTNVTIGIGARPLANLNFTLDYYNIKVKDRIVLGTEIGATANGGTALDVLLEKNNLSDLSFFSNAIDTRTSGIDFVANYRNIALGNGKMHFNLSGNYTIENKRIGNVKNPEIVAQAGQSVVNATQEALFFSSRPKTKWILGTTYAIGKFDFSLNNTYFGKTEFRQQGMNTNLKTEFIPKVLTDLAISFKATEKIGIHFNVNNIFDVLPEWKFVALNQAGQNLLNTPAQTKTQSNLITFNQRYPITTYDGSHFSQLGTMFSLSLQYKL